MSMVRVSNLWRFYNGAPAVKGLDMEVDRGSAYGFIGPNGAGKSTTLRVLATLDRPDAGRVWVDGVDVQHECERVRQSLGFMPDPFNLYDDLLVRDMLDFFAEVYRVDRRLRRKRVEQAIELTRIQERLGNKCGALSKGWRQRVLLAKILVHDPKVLLLDEPASGLDPAARIEFREIVRALRDMGKTIVVSSHILTELADFCDSVGIIEEGRMLVSGRIDDILDRLDPRDQLEFEVLGDPTGAVQYLGDAPGVSETKIGEPPATPDLPRTVTAVLEGRGTPEDRARILEGIQAAGARVCGLKARRENLEELFLKVAGKLEGGDNVMSPEVLRSLLGANQEVTS